MSQITNTRPARRTTIKALDQAPVVAEENQAENALPAGVARELQQLMIDCHELNATANAAKNTYEKKRAMLLRRLTELNKSEHTVAFKKGSNTITLEALVSQSVRSTIDVEKLRKQVPDDAAFLQMISASITAVESVAGTNIANMCKTETRGDYNVSVKVKK